MMLPAMPESSSNRGLGSVNGGITSSPNPVDGEAPELNDTTVWRRLAVIPNSLADKISNNAQVLEEDGTPRKFTVKTDVGGADTGARDHVNSLPIWWGQLIDADGKAHTFSFSGGNVSTSAGQMGDSENPESSYTDFLGTPTVYIHQNPLYSTETRTNSLINTEVARQWKLTSDGKVTMTEVYDAASDGAMDHTFYITNHSGTDYNFRGIYWNLDTMLDDDDGITVYADGHGGGYLVNNKLTVALTPKFGTKIAAMQWSSGDHFKDLSTSPTADISTQHEVMEPDPDHPGHERPATNRSGQPMYRGVGIYPYTDSALHYQLKPATIPDGKTKVWGFTEQMFTGGMSPTEVGIVRTRYINKDNGADIAQVRSQYTPLNIDTASGRPTGRYETTPIAMSGWHYTGSYSGDTPTGTMRIGTIEVNYQYEENHFTTAEREVSYGQKLTVDDAKKLVKFNGESILDSNGHFNPTFHVNGVEWIDGTDLNIPNAGRDVENGEHVTTLSNGPRDDVASDNGKKSVEAYVKIQFDDGTPDYLLPVKLTVHSGYAGNPTIVKVEGTTGEASVSELNADKAKQAIQNASELSGESGSIDKASTFEFVKSDGQSLKNEDLKYDPNNNDASAMVDGNPENNLTPVSVGVKITYAQGATQIVPVTVYIAADASKYKVQTVNSITVHTVSDEQEPVESQIADFVDPRKIKDIVQLSDTTNVTIPDSSSVIKNITWVDPHQLDFTAVNDTQSADIKVNYKDGSSVLYSNVTVHIIGGKKNTSSSVVVNNGDNLPDAKNAISNTSDLDQFGYHYSGDRPESEPITYKWAENEDGSGTPDVTWSESSDPSDRNGNQKKSAYVIIKYGDNTTQSVLVDYEVRSDAKSFDGNVNVKDANLNPVYAHVNENIQKVDSAGKLEITDHDHVLQEDTDWTFMNWAAKNGNSYIDFVGSTTRNVSDDGGLSPEGVKTVQDFYAKIKFADGSYMYSPQALPIKVIGAVAQDVIFERQDTNTAPDAMTKLDKNLNTVISNTDTAPSGDGIGQFDIDQIDWKFLNSDGTTSAIDWTKPTLNNDGQAQARNIQLTIHYKDGADQTEQVVTKNADGNPLTLTILSTTSSIDPNSGITIAHDNTVRVHANATAELANSQGKDAITIKDNQGNEVAKSGWNVVGWATKSGNTYNALDSSTLTNDLKDNGLDSNGEKYVVGSGQIYAKIQFSDGGVLYTPATSLKVIGAIGEDVTFDKQTTNTAPNAMIVEDVNHKTAIKNATAPDDGLSQFDNAAHNKITYIWTYNVDVHGHRAGDTVDWMNGTKDASGNWAAVPVKVKVDYGDGTSQDITLNLKIRNDSERNGGIGNVQLANTSNPVTAHANEKLFNVGVNRGMLTVKEGSTTLTENTNNTGALNGWKFVGWATKSGNTYTDINSTSSNVLDDSGLVDGVKTVNEAYAKIELEDGSFIYSTATVPIKVTGGVGQAKTYAVATSAPDAKEGVKNADAVNTLVPGATYRWVKYTGTGTPTHSTADAFTDFSQPAALDAQGKSIANNDIYVEIDYHDGSYQYVKAPLTINRASDVYGDDITANGTGVVTHVNAPSTSYAPGAGFTNNIPASAGVTVSYAWATAPDVTATGLNGEGKKDETRPVTITFTDSHGLTSTLTKDVAVHVTGGVAASEHQSVQQSTLPTAEQAKDAIGNNAALTPYGAEYAWYASEGGSPLTTSNTVLPRGTNTGSKQVWIKISYKKAGAADGEQWVQTTLDLKNDLAHQFHDLLSSNTVTVVKSNTPISGNLVNGSINNAVIQDATTRLYHLGTAPVINIPNNLPRNTVFSWVTPVDISSVGNVVGNVQVAYSDGSKDTIPAVVHVIDHIPKMNEIFTPAGGEIWVAPNTALDPTHGADRAEAGITNHAEMPTGIDYSWSATPRIDTSHPGTRLVGIVNVKYSDNTSNSASVVIHVNGRSTEEDHPTVPSEASRYTPQGKDLYKQVDTAHPNDIGDAKLAIANTADSSAADKLPGDATFSWQYVDNNILATAGTKGAIVRVTYGDRSHTDVPIAVHVTASQTEAELHPATGQDITTTVGDPAHKVKAQNGIANVATMPAGTTYSWVGAAPDVSREADIPANVKVAYQDGSANTVAIMVHVANSSESGRTLASDLLNPTGGTITEYKDANAQLTIPEVLEKLNSQHSFFTNDNPASVPGANPIQYEWADSHFGENVLKSTGLKSGQVLIKYGDNSTDTVTVMVDVKDLASKYDNLTAKAITTTVGGSVTAKQGLESPIPDDELTKIDFVSPVNLNAAGTSADPKAPSYTAQAAGTYGENIKITFKDNSTKILATSLVVSSPNQRLADVMIPTGGLITRYVGDSLGTSDAQEAVSDNGDMPDNTHYSWVVTPDTSSKGLKSGEVQVSYPDNSAGTVMVHVNVKPLADKYTPLGQSITIGEPSSEPLSGSNRAKDGISNTIQLPADAVYAWATPVDISQADTTVPGLVKVTYRDNSVDTVAVSVIVGHPENNPQTNNPVAKIINVNYGDVFVNNSDNAKRGVQNTANMPSDAVYSFVGALPTDGSNKIDQTGDVPVLVHIVGTDYDKSVATVIHVVSASQNLDAGHEAPIGQDIYAKAGDPLPDPKKGIIGADDPDSPLAREGASYSWATGGEPDISTVGTKSGIVQVNYGDGSSKLVPVTVTVTPDGNPAPVPGEGQVTAAGYHPFGKSLERQKSNYRTLNDADARVAVGFPDAETVPAGTSYSWVDPNFARTALRTKGYKTSQVKVTYADGSESIVLATVHVTSMADDYTPAPLPITYDPDGLGLPGDLNDPDNPTPAIDPSSLPSGTLVRFPAGVNPQNMTPGDHPVQVEVDYPDGTHVIVPTVIHVPAKDTGSANNGDSLFFKPDNSLLTPGASVPTGNVPNAPVENSANIPVANEPASPAVPSAGNSGSGDITVPTATVPNGSTTAAGEATGAETTVPGKTSVTADNTNGAAGNTVAGTSDNTTVDTNNNDHDVEIPARAGVHQKLVIYIGKSGRIVKKAYISVGKGYQSLEKLFKLAQDKDKMPKGYKVTGKVKKVAKHLDVWVIKSGQPGNKRAPRTKDVLYITKDGKIVKRTRITGSVSKLAKSKLPKGYKITGIDRVHNHYNVWIKKAGK
ncbi:Rib/alpha-like domain-containing protein [Lactobacillus ultunensis]|nr:Rib/alpha-like domain-containing protein [Lactobacillus ultunensis]KRL82293.1 hypothetical protein FC57_GL001990 [Lactobacillus ultunensis DSM 16047]